MAKHPGTTRTRIETPRITNMNTCRAPNQRAPLAWTKKKKASAVSARSSGEAWSCGKPSRT
jgi:hypothetical protein